MFYHTETCLKINIDLVNHSGIGLMIGKQGYVICCHVLESMLKCLASLGQSLTSSIVSYYLYDLEEVN